MQGQPEPTIKDELNLYKLDGFTVTSHRVRDSDSEYLRSIMLEAICCCTAHRRERTGLLVVGILCFVVALILFVAASGPSSDTYLLGAFASLAFGIVLLGAWYRSRQRIIIVASANGTIERDFGFKADPREVIEIIEAAKYRRVGLLPIIADQPGAVAGEETR